MRPPHIAILMTVKDGANFLPAQLASIARQRHNNWMLFASDDGSLDNSKQILSDFHTEQNEVRIIDGPQQGHATNAIFLLSQALGLADSGSWLALCDQDDVWLSDRLSRGIEAIEGLDGPALYCSRTIIADSQLGNRHVSRRFKKAPDFRNALVQNIASGNTILLNSAGAKLVCSAAEEAHAVVAPDWWIYQLITGAGGNVVYDTAPSLIYRQHASNQFGENRSALARARRVGMILKGDFRHWIDQNIETLSRSEDRLDDVNRKYLHEFANLRSKNMVSRMRSLQRLGIYRQSHTGTVALWCAALFGRL